MRGTLPFVSREGSETGDLDPDIDLDDDRDVDLDLCLVLSFESVSFVQLLPRFVSPASRVCLLYFGPACCLCSLSLSLSRFTIPVLRLSFARPKVFLLHFL